MGRVKLPLKLIECEKSRKITALKRTKGLKKKASELATLCGVEVCVICFGPERDQPEILPENMSRVLSIVKLYRKIPQDVREKNQLHLTDFMEAKVRKLKIEFDKKEKMEIHYPTWDDQLNDYSEEGLRNLASFLDSKLGMVKQRGKTVREREEKWEEKSVMEVGEAIQSLSNYLLGTVESRNHWSKEYNIGPQYCHPNNRLPFSYMGFPAGSHNAGIGTSGFSGEQEMDNLLYNKMVAYNNFNVGSYNAGLWQSGLNPPSTSIHDSSSFGSNEFQSGPFWQNGASEENWKAIGSGNQYYFSGEQEMDNLFHNKMVSYNNLNVGSYNAGLWQSGLNPPSNSLHDSSSFGSNEFQAGPFWQHAAGEENWKPIGSGNQYYFSGF